jgi:hypothetical protein
VKAEEKKYQAGFFLLPFRFLASTCVFTSTFIRTVCSVNNDKLGDVKFLLGWHESAKGLVDIQFSIDYPTFKKKPFFSPTSVFF